MTSQKREQSLQQIISQNYANNTLFMTLSCLETIEQKYLKVNQPKFFGAYDVIDYSHRPIEVLKEQLRLSLLQVDFAYNSQTENGSEFVLPSDCDMQKVLTRLEQSKQLFQQRKDNDCLSMIADLQNILKGYKEERSYMKMRFQNEKSKSFSENAQNMLQTSEKVAQVQKFIREKYNPNMKQKDIPFLANPQFKKKYSKENKKQSN